MKLNLLGTTVILLVAFLPRYECRAFIDSPGEAQRAPPPPSPHEERPERRQLQQSVPIWERLGEEYFIRLGNNGNSNSLGLPLPSSMLSPAHYNRASQLHLLTQRLLQRKAGSLRALVGGLANLHLNDSVETQRGRRSEEPPISLDLTFHLLREMMEMSKNENLAQQAQSNRRMMELFGK